MATDTTVKRKRVLDVGQCRPDHMAIRSFVEEFGAEVVQIDYPADAAMLIEKEHFDLVLVNRKIDADYSDGIELVRILKRNPGTVDVPIMLISNYPEAQKEAREAGAEPGFGKKQIGREEIRKLLSAYI